MAHVAQLLDDSRLEGVVAVNRYLGPPLHAALVNGASLEDAIHAVEQCCQMWGAALSPLIPLAGTPLRIESPWDEYLSGCEIDSVRSRGLLPDHPPNEKLHSHHVEVGLPGSDSILRVIHAGGKRPEQLMHVRIACPSASDPWFVAYAGSLGLLPTRPDPSILKRSNYQPELDFDSFIIVDDDVVESPGPDDLLSRIRDPGALSPTRLSLLWLSVSPALVDMSLVGGHPVFPWQAGVKRNSGANVVVIYEPGSVEDLCLLWNLRAAHGLPRGFPLAIPLSCDVPRVIDSWSRAGATTLWQLRGPNTVLASLSADAAVLDDISGEVASHPTPVSASDVLQAPCMPGRPSSDVATFADGVASIPAWSATDREAIRPGRSPFDSWRLKARIRPQARQLPPSKFMERRTSSWSGGPRGGAWEHPTSKPMDIATVHWPSGWTVLKAVARDRGVRAEPSAAGRVAAALLRQLGSMIGLEPLLDRQLIVELERLSQRDAMSWFKDRLRRIGRAIDASAEKALTLEQQIDELHIPRLEGEDGELLTCSRLKDRVFRDQETAKQWLSWAEKSGLVVRGVQTTCDKCGAKSWRAMGEIAPPIVCRGCGNQIDRAFPAANMTFFYRASEPLVRVMQHDTLVHLLALRFFCELLGSPGDRPSFLYGGYPGVDFFDEESGKPLGEADVVLVFSNGDLAIGECKKSGKGLTAEGVAKLDGLSEKLAAEWSFVATLSASEDCPPIWQGSERALPERPRFAIAGESLLRHHIVWLADENPVSWPGVTKREQEEDETNSDVMKRTLEWLQGQKGWDRYIFTD